jgi:hypothetical protein
VQKNLQKIMIQCDASSEHHHVSNHKPKGERGGSWVKKKSKTLKEEEHMRLESDKSEPSSHYKADDSELHS